jgi:hypothetical protein
LPPKRDRPALDFHRSSKREEIFGAGDAAGEPAIALVVHPVSSFTHASRTLPVRSGCACAA